MKWTYIYYNPSPTPNPSKRTVKVFLKSLNTQGREEWRGDRAIKLKRLERNWMSGKGFREKRMIIDSRDTWESTNLYCRLLQSLRDWQHPVALEARVRCIWNKNWFEVYLKHNWPSSPFSRYTQPGDCPCFTPTKDWRPLGRENKGHLARLKVRWVYVFWRVKTQPSSHNGLPHSLGSQAVALCRS